MYKTINIEYKKSLLVKEADHALIDVLYADTRGIRKDGWQRIPNIEVLLEAIDTKLLPIITEFENFKSLDHSSKTYTLPIVLTCTGTEFSSSPQETSTYSINIEYANLDTNTPEVLKDAVKLFCEKEQKVLAGMKILLYVCFVEVMA